MAGCLAVPIIRYLCKIDCVYKIYYVGTVKCNIIHEIMISNAAYSFCSFVLAVRRLNI